MSTPDNGRIYDVAGIGVGPFNLGLAALSEPLEDLDCVFLDRRESFDWHPGMMLEPAQAQNLEFRYYPAGHMVYLNPDALHAMRLDVEQFIHKAVAEAATGRQR